MHPNPEVSAKVHGRFGAHPRVNVTPPLPYAAFVRAMGEADFIMSDSGGVQEESTYLGIPCLTLRENTERPITVEQGTNALVGRDRQAILDGADQILAGRGKRGRVPENWDGHAAERIAADLWHWLHTLPSSS